MKASDVLTVAGILAAALEVALKALAAGSTPVDALKAAEERISSERAAHKYPDLREADR